MSEQSVNPIRGGEGKRSVCIVALFIKFMGLKNCWIVSWQ